MEKAIELDAITLRLLSTLACRKKDDSPFIELALPATLLLG